MIADLLDQPVRRVEEYIGSQTPVGHPLPPNRPAPPGISTDDMAAWQQHTLLDDIGDSIGLTDADRTPWRDLKIDVFYQRAVCGSGIVELADARADRRRISVPLAHQSALAGIMLAVQLIAAQQPNLRQLRPDDNEARFDLLRTAMPYTTARGRTAGCLCADDDYRTAYGARWPSDHAPRGPQNPMGATATMARSRRQLHPIAAP